ncbi:uncharacterized protein LOC113516160 [Galleria mellonella]|uniref:Uncharacterized protein LOC113516160 n=1 Tax=Galleria mellonella TaxID=7137 RepID=A0A6J1WUR6_GALME|nr:uncharacterized protein LOC113516160 [Galleria mellonella]
MKRISFSIFILCGLFECGLGILCYECNSATNLLCTEAQLPDSLKRNCSEHGRGVTHTLCRKIVQHVDYGINGQLPTSRVIRSCGWDESKYKGACYHRSGYGGRQEVCSCTKDYCNSSEKTEATLFSLKITILMFIGTYVCE